MLTTISQRVAQPCCSSSRQSPTGSRLPVAAAWQPAVAARQQQHAARGQSTVVHAVVDNDDDLWQHADRDKWYAATWCALDQPDWNAARFVSSTQLAPGIREVVVECEISREKVPLRNAYKHVGQRASVRINSGSVAEVPTAGPPFPDLLNKAALLRVRGDIRAEETKSVKELYSVLVELPLYVRESEAPDLYKMTDEDSVEVGPFVGVGLNLRGPIAAVFLFPTVVMFVEGAGIATAKALIEAGSDPCGLGFKRRQDVRMYYRAPNEASMCWPERYEEWGKRYGVQVTISTRDSFADMFDDDETLMYDPDTTGALILVGDDEEAEAAAADVCKEAEITIVVKQSEEPAATEYLTFGKPRD